MQVVKEVSDAAAVIGYRKSIFDTYTNLAEVLLYERLIRYPGTSPQKMVEMVGRVLSQIGADTANYDEKTVRKPVLVCF